jgi:phage-related protein (TIGR01555 family)
MKKRAQKGATFVEDSFVNAFANIGTARDKQSYSTYQRDAYPDDFFENMYLSWAAGQIVDVPANDMTREWRTIQAPSLSPEQIEEVQNEETRLAVKSKFQEAKKYARLYGGSIGIMVVEGAGFPDEPLDPSRVRQGALKHINVFDKTEAYVEEVDRDPLSENYRQPLFYRINSSSQKIHYTRVLRFSGTKVPWQMRRGNLYWDYSVLQRCVDPIKKFDTIYNSISSMTFESNVDVISVENLFEKLTQPGGKRALQARFSEGALLKSINNMLLLDSREKWDRKTQTFAGLPDLLIKSLSILSASSDIPATRFLSQSPTGLNATGDADLENYYTRIHADQEEEFRPNLDWFDEVFARSTLGFKPDDWTFEFDPLWSMSEGDTAEKQLKDSTRDRNYLDGGVVTPSIVAQNLKEDGVYSIDDEYLEALKELDFEETPDAVPDIEGLEDPEIEGLEDPEIEGLEDPEIEGLAA